MPPEFLIVSTSVATKGDADFLASQILNARLAACVHIVPRVESHYWWKGSLRMDSEVTLSIKTAPHLLEALTRLIQAKHQYECPEIVAITPTSVAPHFAAWWREQLLPPE